MFVLLFIESYKSEYLNTKIIACGYTYLWPTFTAEIFNGLHFHGRSICNLDEIFKESSIFFLLHIYLGTPKLGIRSKFLQYDFQLCL